MRHDWILDVLTDIHAYASRNDLPALAEKVEAALDAALQEISELDRADPSILVRRAARGGRPN